MTLTREQLLAPRKLPMEEVPVPELEGTIFVRTMSGGERDAYEYQIVKLKETGQHLENLRARLVTFTACDSDGKLLFTPEDVAALGLLSGTVLDRLAAAASRMNRFNGE